MRRSVRFAASFLSVAFAAALAFSGCRGEMPRPVDRNGRAVAIEVAGHPTTMLHFWATWCGPCRQELPKLLAYAKAHDVRLITVARDASFRDVDAYVNANGLEMPVLLDADGRVCRAYHADALPTTLIYDERGTVRERYVGMRDW